MPDLLSILTSLAWPFAVAVAWLAGEFGQRWTGFPRVSFYGLVGFILASGQAGVLPVSSGGPVLVMADVAFGLMLFELGYRINLRWLRTNPWIGVTGLAEAGATFAAVYLVGLGFGNAHMTALMLASLSMATSPATVVRVINEQRSSGQVTERVMHLSALNCVLSVFFFNLVVGISLFRASEDLADAALNSLAVLGMSALAGAVAGLVVPGVLRALGNLAQDATVGFALAVILLVAVAYTFRLSPVVAALAFGLTARHRRVAFAQAQRNFGALGELLAVLLFVFAASTLDWRQVQAGGLLAIALIVVRLLTKTFGVTAFAHLSGISWRKGALTGLGLAPLSVFVILMLEHARQAGLQLAEAVRALAAVTLLLELFAPFILQRALMWAHETPERPHGA
ncbi:MAG: sodium:proton antiporter [Massilia sp.]|jgi:Kef-type K+ transport system membrane component KefB|nr:sodium:proton antiporter [Massilia sp.]